MSSGSYIGKTYMIEIIIDTPKELQLLILSGLVMVVRELIR